MSGALSVQLRGRVGALDLDAAFAAPAGRVTALSGASGSGKTTILRALAGLTRLDGAVRVGDETWQDARCFLPPPHRRVGYVFQQGALFPHLSVAGNLDYARRRSGATDAERGAVVDWLRLEALLPRAPERLSGGERARAALARALLTRPALVLLDEPLNGLDAAARAELAPLLRAALHRLAAPVLYVSHDGGELAAICDDVLSLQGGRIAPAAVATDSLDGLAADQVSALARAALRAGLTP